jgi:hypothetical protein
MKYLILIFIFCCFPAFAREELLVIQTVSVDQKSFVIAKGAKDGISVGQELIFANENVSLVCKVVEVNHNYSYWYPVNTNINIPFERNEIVSANSHTYGSISIDLEADKNNLVETIENKIQNERDIEFFRGRDHYTLRGSYGLGLAQNISSVSSTQNATRYSYELSFEYNIRLRPEYELGFGGRFDSEISKLTNPSLDVQTMRLMAIAVATYHFVNWSITKNNVYVSLVAGLGTSKTVVNQATNSGIAVLLPQIRLGYVKPYSRTSALILEASVENISAREKLPDNTVQTSSYTNLKGTVGVSF